VKGKYKIMGKLRMKETPQDRHIEEDHRKKRRRRKREEDGTAESSKRSSKSSSSTRRRHRRRSTSPSSSSTSSGSESATAPARKSDSNADVVNDDSDSYVPPRPSKDRPYIPYSYNDEDDESKLPPSQSEKRDTAIDDDETFQKRLFDAMREDERTDAFDASTREAGFGFDYREALPERKAFGRSNVVDDRYVDPLTGIVVNRVIFKDAMNEDEWVSISFKGSTDCRLIICALVPRYADHIRHGMYRRTRKEEIARQERLAAERKAKEAKKAEEFRRMQDIENERQKQLDERVRRKKEEGVTKSREAYQASWARLVDPNRQSELLAMEDYPWPHLSEMGEMNAETVKRFLLNHLNDIDDEQELEKKRKQAIRTAVLAYHPDRFERYVLRAKKESQRESIREMGCESVDITHKNNCFC
jgi:hypothetical protein